MRVTSPPKHFSQVQKCSSPQKKLNQLLSSPTHNLKPHAKNNSNTQSQTTKEKIRGQIKTRQLQYVQLIKDLSNQNKQLKAELGRLSLEQSKRQSISTIIHVSPNKALNQTMTDLNLGQKPFNKTNNRNFQNVNQTFDNFYSFNHNLDNQNRQIQKNLSPFSKKAASFKPTSPKIVYQAQIRPTSPLNIISKVQAPISSQNMNKVKSPLKKQSNHSYNPSLISYQFQPSQNQSLNQSPKKSFEFIASLNSDIFSAVGNAQNNQQMINGNQNQNISQNPISNFFNMKKRQINYGFVYTKDKPTSGANCETILKMGSNKTLISKLKQNQSHELLQEPHNPLTSKRNKQLKRQKSENVENLNEVNQKDQFNLQQRISNNPLMSLLKKKLQEEGQIINGQFFKNKLLNSHSISKSFSQGVNTPSEEHSFNESSPYNQNIRFISNQNSKVFNPLKINIIQGFPMLNKISTFQKKQIDLERQDDLRRPVQIIRESLEEIQKLKQSSNSNSKSKGNSNFNSNSNSNSEFHFHSHSRSNKSDSKCCVSKQSEKTEELNESEYVIQEGRSCHKAMTIVQMLQKTRKQGQNKNELSQKQIQSLDKVTGQEQYTNLVQIDRQLVQNQYNHCNHRSHQNHHNYRNNQSQQQQQQAEQQLQTINNRYYCQKTQDNQDLRQENQSNQHNSHSQEHTCNDKGISQSQCKHKNKNVSINQSENVTQVLSSHKILHQSNQSKQILNQQNPSDQNNLNQNKHIKQGQSYQHPNNVQFYAFTSRNQQIQQINPNIQLSSRQKQKMNRSSQYQLFYATNNGPNDQKLNRKSSMLTRNENNGKNNGHAKENSLEQISKNNYCKKEAPNNSKYQQFDQFDCNLSSTSTLRSQRFKKISNKAYL